MSEKRKSISKKVRFDVFKRDNFTCQYCGKKAPDVILEVDHIKPVSKGGTNNILNLITSCYECNRGKSNKELNENQTLVKELKQMELLNERKQQIEMMFEWQNELLNQERTIIVKILLYYEDLVGMKKFTYAIPHIEKALKKYSVEEIINAIKVLKDMYDPYDTFDNLNKMLASLRLQKKKPYMKQIFYLRGILRNRLNGRYYDNKKALQYLVSWYENNNVRLDELEQVVKSVNNWSDFVSYKEVFEIEN